MLGRSEFRSAFFTVQQRYMSNAQLSLWKSAAAIINNYSRLSLTSTQTTLDALYPAHRTSIPCLKCRRLLAVNISCKSSLICLLLYLPVAVLLSPVHGHLYTRCYLKKCYLSRGSCPVPPVFEYRSVWLGLYGGMCAGLQVCVIPYGKRHPKLWDGVPLTPIHNL